MCMRLADLIREERERQGLEKQDLARLAHVSTGTITRFESGEIAVGRGGTVSRITKALGIDANRVAAILREEDETETDRHYVDLSRVLSSRRRGLIRNIDALVREARKAQED